MSLHDRPALAGVLVVLGAIALGYSVFVVLEPTAGVAVALACLFAAAVLHPRTRIPIRQASVWFAALVVVAHGVSVGRFLDAVLVATAVYVAAWITGPEGPFAAE